MGIHASNSQVLNEKHLLKKKKAVTDASLAPKEHLRHGNRRWCQRHVLPLFSCCIPVPTETSRERDPSPEPTQPPGGASVLLLRAGFRAAWRGRAVLVLCTYLPLLVSPLQPWEPQCFCSNFPHEAVCADPWGQALLVSTDAGVLLVDG